MALASSWLMRFFINGLVPTRARGKPHIIRFNRGLAKFSVDRSEHIHGIDINRPADSTGLRLLFQRKQQQMQQLVQ